MTALPTVGKKDLIDAIASDDLGLSKQTVERVYDRMIAIIAGELAAGNAVRLHQFGTLEPVLRSARQGRNPATGAPLDIPSRIDVRFKAAAPLRRALNPESEPEMED